MRILGVDPGLQVTGYAVLEVRPQRPHVCEAGIIRTTTDGDRRSTNLAPRLLSLYNGLVEVLDELKPQVVAVEQLYAHYAHPRTAILMGHARGVIFLAAAQRELPLLSYASTRIKKTITGHGRATKEQMQDMVQLLLGLAERPRPADAADAAAIALCHVAMAPMRAASARSDRAVTRVAP